MQNTKNGKLTALYSRLSRDDAEIGDSDSIKHQKEMLEEYAAKNGFANTAHFSDDGYSGGNFERPGWQALIAEIEAGNVGLVLAKDMSRIGREYLQTGFYTEVFFREKGVRFIAIANNIDSQNRESSEFAPFLNIMSEWYLRDASRKVKAVHKSRGLSGKRLTFKPIFGYMRDPNDKDGWIIDTEAAAVVRRIFALTIDGKGPCEIARIFNEEKVERPSYYQRSRGIVKLTMYDDTHPYSWSGNTIAHMLAKPEYMGDTVNFRSYKDSYKDKRSKQTPKDQVSVFRDTHPAIVDRQTWETAQKCRETKRIKNFHGEANPLTGRVFCSDCGAKLYNHRNPNPHSYVNKKGYNCTRAPRDWYVCSTHNLSGRRFDRQCTQHNIRTELLCALVLAAIQSVSGFVKSNEAEFVRQVREKSAITQETAATAHKKKIAAGQRRVGELNALIRRIYEDYVGGKLNEKRYEMLAEEYERKQADLEQSIAALKAELESFNADSDRADRFIEIVKRHTDFSELTPAMIAEFLEKVVVYEADRSSGERVQKVDIYLNFIGKFELPADAPSQEEIQAEERARRKRKKSRECQRRYAERQKLKERQGEEREAVISALPAQEPDETDEDYKRRVKLERQKILQRQYLERDKLKSEQYQQKLAIKAERKRESALAVGQ